MRRTFLILLLLLMAAPARATMIVVSLAHPDTLVPNLPGYLAAVPSYGNSIRTAVQNASANDTIYAHSGTHVGSVVSTDWNADGLTVIGAQDLTTEWIGSASTYTVSVGDNATSENNRIENIRFDCDPATGTDRAIVIDRCRGTTIYNCVVEGPYEAAISYGAAHTAATDGAVNVTVEACSLGTNYTAGTPTYAPISVITGNSNDIPGADGLTFKDSTLDFSGAYADRDVIQLRGVTDFLMEGCVVKAAQPQNAGSGFVISVYSEGTTAVADGVTIRDTEIHATYNGSSGGVVTVGIGRYISPSQDNIVDNVTLERVLINVPRYSGYFGLKVEGDYNGTVGADASYSDNINLIDVVAVGGITGLGFHENTRNASMTRCRIIGPGLQADLGYPTYGIVIEDARHVRLIDNWVSNAEKGITLSHSGDLTPANGFHNYDVYLGGNVFQNCAKGVNYQYYEGGNTVTTDSLFVSQGNLFFNVGSVGYLDDAASPTGSLSLATYKARAIIAGSETGSQNDAYGWSFGAGDEEYTGDVPAWVRKNGGIPYRFHKTFGTPGVGIVR